MSESQVRVGVGVFIFNDENQILLGLRKSDHAYNTWSPPGGHLEFGETPEVCVKREAMEEANIVPLIFTNDIYPDENRHYVTLQYKGKWVSGDIQINEPDKMQEWQWFDWGNMPENLFPSVKKLQAQMRLNEILAL